tara:strand:+ start:193 stop:732 length:540 start_codon:yes stop_codon:yes gene_type:complete
VVKALSKSNGKREREITPEELSRLLYAQAIRLQKKKQPDPAKMLRKDNGGGHHVGKTANTKKAEGMTDLTDLTDDFLTDRVDPSPSPLTVTDFNDFRHFPKLNVTIHPPSSNTVIGSSIFLEDDEDEDEQKDENEHEDEDEDENLTELGNFLTHGACPSPSPKTVADGPDVEPLWDWIE